MIDQHEAASPASLPALATSATAPRRRLSAPAATLTALLRAVERTEDLLDEETFALKDRRAIDLVSFIRRKNEGLLDITRAARALSEYEVGPAVTDRLASLKGKLERFLT